jgi:hypothetical protein
LLNLLDSKLLALLVTSTERIFCKPRWRKGVENSVVEITKDNQNQPIPMKNGILEIGSAVEDQKFIGVQSVVAFENKLMY